MNRAVRILEETAGEGTPVQQGELVTVDLRISLNRGDVVHPRALTTFRVGDRDVFAGLSKIGMRRGGYRKTRVSPHFAYGAHGVLEKVPADAVLICELWVHDGQANENSVN